MTDIPYSKREIDQNFAQISKALERQDEVLRTIESHTEKHNGRMSRLEIAVVAIIALLVGLGFKEVLSVVSLF